MPSLTDQSSLPTPPHLQISLSSGKRSDRKTSEWTIFTHNKPLPLVLAVSIFICTAPSTVPAAVLYSNGFESGVPVYIYDIYGNDMGGDRTNGVCNFGEF